MKLLLMPLPLHQSLVPIEAPFEAADEGVVSPVGLLILLPLTGVLHGLMLVHLPLVDAAPPADVKLVLAQLALQAQLLAVMMASTMKGLPFLISIWFACNLNKLAS